MSLLNVDHEDALDWVHLYLGSPKCGSCDHYDYSTDEGGTCSALACDDPHMCPELPAIYANLKPETV